MLKKNLSCDSSLGDAPKLGKQQQPPSPPPHRSAGSELPLPPVPERRGPAAAVAGHEAQPSWHRPPPRGPHSLPDNGGQGAAVPGADLQHPAERLLLQRDTQPEGGTGHHLRSMHPCPSTKCLKPNIANLQS